MLHLVMLLYLVAVPVYSHVLCLHLFGFRALHILIVQGDLDISGLDLRSGRFVLLNSLQIVYGY